MDMYIATDHTNGPNLVKFGMWARSVWIYWLVLYFQAKFVLFKEKEPVSSNKMKFEKWI